MKRVYLAGGISDKDRFEGQRRTAGKLRLMGYDVYAASENDSINDKSNEPTPLDIYFGDVDRIKESDTFVARLSGGNEDGTISEVGFVTGWNEHLVDEREFNEYLLTLPPEEIRGAIEKRIEEQVEKSLLAYTTNMRLTQPQFHQGMASAGVNHLLLGMIDRWGIFIGGEDEMTSYMRGASGGGHNHAQNKV